MMPRSEWQTPECVLGGLAGCALRVVGFGGGMGLQAHEDLAGAGGGRVEGGDLGGDCAGGIVDGGFVGGGDVEGLGGCCFGHFGRGVERRR